MFTLKNVLIILLVITIIWIIYLFAKTLKTSATSGSFQKKLAERKKRLESQKTREQKAQEKAELKAEIAKKRAEWKEQDDEKAAQMVADGKVEAVEFLVDGNTKNCGVPLKQLKLKKNVLMAAITHRTKTEIPNGDSMFFRGDSVVVVTSGRGILRNFNDIFA